MASPRYAVLLGLVLAAAAAPGDRVRAEFRRWVDKYLKAYGSEEEERKRFDAFVASYNYVERMNAKNQSYTVALNEFAAQTPAEFAKEHLGFRLTPERLWRGLPHLGTHNYSGVALPESVDWVEKGAVTPVKNQKKCGSCWAFSTTGALEGAYKISSGQLVSLSEQQLVDCDKDNKGCNGGGMDLAFEYGESNSLCSEESYPYEAVEGVCRVSECTAAINKGAVTGFKDVAEADETALMEAVSQQPVSVAIEADQMAFQLYSGGILTKECGTKLDHGVLLVGYGTEDGVDYWKVKNSWGPAFGEAGYIRLERGLPGEGECGIKAAASYPVVDAASSANTLVI